MSSDSPSLRAIRCIWRKSPPSSESARRSMSRKWASLVLLTFTLPLVGCSTSPSLEELTKLIEYEKCLSIIEMVQSQALAVEIKEGDIKTDFGIEASLDDCKDYRP